VCPFLLYLCVYFSFLFTLKNEKKNFPKFKQRSTFLPTSFKYMSDKTTNIQQTNKQKKSQSKNKK